MGHAVREVSNNRRPVISAVEFGGLRSFKGRVKLGNGVNLVLGPNSAGKTALIESAFIALLVNALNLRQNLDYLFIIASARGSPRHGFDSLVDTKGVARPCVSIAYGEGLSEAMNVCSEIKRASTFESLGASLLQNVVDISISASSRECGLTIRMTGTRMSTAIRGRDCEKGLLRVGVVPTGILPYNMFDTLVGHFKRSDPEKIRNLSLRLSGYEYTLDLGVDSWNEAVVLVNEVGEKGQSPLIFYSVGRGLQRALQMAFLLETTDILFIDEVESAMHPDLMRTVSTKISSKSRDKQVILTSQSLEAALMIASAILDENRVTGNRVRFFELLDEYGPESESLNYFHLVLMDKYPDGRIKSITLTGYDAMRYLAGSEDARLSYQLLSTR